MMHDDEATARLRDALAALPRELEPARDLWPGIAAGLATRQAAGTRRLWIPMALAASLLLAFSSALGGAWLGYGYAQRQGAALGSAPASAVDLAGIEQDYSAARASYFRELILGDERLDASTRETLRHNLAVIDRATNQLHQALANDPQNPLYVETLLMTREQEMEMLQDISGYSTTSL
jgi:hypothetical protein